MRIHFALIVKERRERINPSQLDVRPWKLRVVFESSTEQCDGVTAEESKPVEISRQRAIRSRGEFVLVLRDYFAVSGPVQHQLDVTSLHGNIVRMLLSHVLNSLNLFLVKLPVSLVESLLRNRIQCFFHLRRRAARIPFLRASLRG